MKDMNFHEVTLESHIEEKRDWSRYRVRRTVESSSAYSYLYPVDKLLKRLIRFRHSTSLFIEWTYWVYRVGRIISLS